MTPTDERSMPFLPVESRGGPHDDDAYAAGWEMGQLDNYLRYGLPVVHDLSIHVENAEQAELVAMSNGYRAVMEPGSDGWCSLRLTRTTDIP